MNTLDCSLENGADLYVKEHQKIRHYRARSTEESRTPNRDIFFTSRGAYVNCTIIAMLYTHFIGNQPYITMVVFKMRDSVPSARYSRICIVLRLCSFSLIPTYGVYRLYDIYIYVYRHGALTSLVELALCRSQGFI